MIWPFNKKKTNEKQLYAIYNAIVAQSRQTKFYREMGVPDNVTGRFDMISLHMILVLRRLRSKEKEIRQFSQDLFDLFFKDMDRSLREMGVSDIGVPKKIQKMGALFYGFLAKLNEALDAKEQKKIQEIINNNIYDGNGGENHLSLAKYVEKTSSHLEKQPIENIIMGEIFFESFKENDKG